MLDMASISSANMLLSLLEAAISHINDIQITMKPLQCQIILQALCSRDLNLEFCQRTIAIMNGFPDHTFYRNWFESLFQ